MASEEDPSLTDKPSIFDYTDYREFLKDNYNFSSSQNKAYSYQFIAQKLGLSKGKAHKLWNGQVKNFPKSLIVKVSEFLKLDRRETEYFNALVAFNETADPDEKTIFYEQMHRVIRPTRKYELRHLQYTLFKEWYIPVIRELVTLVDFKEDFTKLGKMLTPPIKGKQAKEAVELLSELHLIKKEGNRYVQRDKTLMTPPEVRNLAVRHHQKQHLNLVIPSVESNLERMHMITTTTFGINEEGILLLRRRLDQMHQELVDFMSQYDETMNQVYQFNMQLYPLSSAVQREDEE